MRPKCYERETESLHCNLGGTDRSLRLDRNITKETESLQPHLGETEIPIVRLKRLGFLGVDMSNELGGAGWIKLVGPSLTFSLGHMWI